MKQSALFSLLYNSHRVGSSPDYSPNPWIRVLGIPPEPCSLGAALTLCGRCCRTVPSSSAGDVPQLNGDVPKEGPLVPSTTACN